MRFLATIMALLAGACASPLDITGPRYSTRERIADNVYRVDIPASRYSDREMVKDLTLVRAAETAQRAGGTHFLVIRGDDADTLDLPVVFGASDPARKDYTVYVKVLTIAPQQQPGHGALSVEEVLQFIGKRFEKAAT